jgi:formylglycine-generating enzyme required for sulfatase activity
VVNASLPATAMTQPAPRTVRFLLHHPGQTQGFREWLGPASTMQIFLASTSVSMTEIEIGPAGSWIRPERPVVRPGVPAQNLVSTTGKQPIHKATADPAKNSSITKTVPQGPLEDLPEAASFLTMVWIPPGRFWMGSPPTEPEHRESESPLHLVQLQGFFMGQTPITQAQWREVVGWDERPGERWGKVLKADPSRFQSKEGQGENKMRLLAGENNTDQRPVEQVSWEDAMEFCSRLSQRSGRNYTLPSEAQWEYACRAGTTTPFHFGDTISPELANYDGNRSYADGPKGLDREQTTPVGMFPANAWGLMDMHGNLNEWCLDEWHESYKGAPTDGRAWVDAEGGEKSKESEKTRLLRGGSWNYGPRGCRSACRNIDWPYDGLGNVGFRVVCLPQDPSLNP